jgi:Acetoacetate decarboxylase (ADC)
MTSYPPQPWHLHGQAQVSVWRVPVARLPGTMPSGVSPLTIRGQALVGTAWIDYQPGGVLSYRELLAAVLARAGVRPVITITEIWVDSPASLAGGRELWGIPKHLARFELTEHAARAEDLHGMIASAELRRRAGLPVRLPVRFTVAQRFPVGFPVGFPGSFPGGFPLAEALDGGTRNSPVRVSGHPHAAAARWHVNPDGPLGYLHGLTPIAAFQLRDFRMCFGR